MNSGCAIKGNKYSKLSGEKKPKTEGPNSIPAIISPKTDGSLNFLKSSANSLAIININYTVSLLINTPDREEIIDREYLNAYWEN